MMFKWIWLWAGVMAFSTHALSGQSRWELADGPRSIVWRPAAGEAHDDHIEMSGRQVSAVLRYGVDSLGGFHLERGMVWPMLRTIPNNTHASLMYRCGWDPTHAVTIEGISASSALTSSVMLDGALTVTGAYTGMDGMSWTLVRTVFPSATAPTLVEVYELANTGSSPFRVEIPKAENHVYTDPAKGVSGAYDIEWAIDTAGRFTVEPGDTLRFSAHVTAAIYGKPMDVRDAMTELDARRQLVSEVTQSLVLDTPNDTINAMQAFSKIRACESIFQTKGGPLHGPGGEAYYAAIWANDQAEYINPYFPFVGYDYGNLSAMNSFRLFARYVNPDFRPLPSSIIAEGDDVWAGAGDRGDAAMIAYGAARYALAGGSHDEAGQLWPLIEWCLDYCRHRLNDDGVVCSDSDELEGRFPSGHANLCTSSLYYDALISASYLAPELGEGDGADFKRQADTLRRNIDSYFGHTVEGFDTYAYFRGNDRLRSWICIPLSVGIGERKEATLAALFSDKLWTPDGLLTQSGDATFWDRSTLYALRGAYTVGATEKATDYLARYSAARLLGEHVPYAIEAWPEGNQRHLSAESGLYGRIITEGLFGIRPTGLRSFTLAPRLPRQWDYMNLRRIKAFGSTFDIEVSRIDGDRISIEVVTDDTRSEYCLRDNDSIDILL